ncbi:MAG: hypothetical protein HUU46_23540 [Candidatus Hydrogenedentes bacterium]|nr:hypothetical protein [Candidatus Hydrogenedentota bacterium]
MKHHICEADRMIAPVPRKIVSTRLASLITRVTPIALIVALAACARADLNIAAHQGAITVNDNDTPVFASVTDTPLHVLTPSGAAPVAMSVDSGTASMQLSGIAADTLKLEQTFRRISSDLIAREVSASATVDMRYYIDFGWKVVQAGPLYSFTGEEAKSASYTPSCSGPEFGGGSYQTFPFMGYVHDGALYGVVADTPGLWENRCFMRFDLENRALHLANGDGSAKRVIAIPREVDATTVYRATFDGWQHIEAGETQSFTTWIFKSPAKTLYDVQLGAHLALANAKGWNSSALEAILRNTSYVLLRRNLLRPESDHIFISGVGYGWKQWVTDGFYMSRGLDDPVYDAAAFNAVFYDRIAYEDNAQYYLIWAALVKRAGGDIDMRTVDRAYRFMRANERDGLFQPPRLKPDHKGFRTYHDLLEYDDGDTPSANQGFHCGALLAARELGYAITGEEVEKAKAGYASMFNADGGYMQTSLMKPELIGQDSLYGEVLTFAVFGEKLLPDDIVRKHLETTMRIQSPYGMRVISKANGDLVDGHSGVYVFGGSWFLNDSANYLCGLIHGMDPKWVDDRLVWRVEKELAAMPAFHESISTVDGHPHGHHLYSWNSGYHWLRKNVRARLNMPGPDPVETRLDEVLGISKNDANLTLNPRAATLRPANH